MNLLPIVERILLENDIQTDDLSKEVEISERGVAFLKDKIDKLNVKANRWGLPPMSLSVLHEREIPIKQRNMWGEEETVGIRKLFIVKIEGNPPRVEGYTFIGKVQHTTGGDNILNIAPGSPIKSLPEIYRIAKAECDVCKEKRERFNTFILQLDKEDHQRFSEKKVGDLVQVGSACLGRFLPGVSVDALMHYASIIEELRAYREGSGGDEWDDDMDYDPERGAPNPYRRHVPTETLLKYVALVYVTNGEYVSKSKGASSFGEKTPTSDEALNVMFDSKHQTHIHQEVIRTPSLKDKADVLAAQVGHWMKNMDFNELGKNTPEWQNYFGNLQIISRSSTMDIKNAGYLGGVFQTYLKIEREKEKEASAKGKGYIGTVGQRVSFNGNLRFYKPLSSDWGVAHLYVFEDPDKNNVKWISSKDVGLQTGTTYSMSGKVKGHEIDKWNKQPTTVITHGKIEAM